MQQDCYVTMEMQLVYRSCYQGNLICNIIYIYIYVCVCVCVCVYSKILELIPSCCILAKPKPTLETHARLANMSQFGIMSEFFSLINNSGNE
jgi:hypothetical protein